MSPSENKNVEAGLTVFAASNPSGFRGFEKNAETLESEFDKKTAKLKNAESGFEIVNGGGGAVTGIGGVFIVACFSALTIEKFPIKITGSKNAIMINEDNTRIAFETVKKDRH
ncbi:MAG: hypothetical protein ACR2F2_12800 [Pyrinomonadaceae bacterium]